VATFAAAASSAHPAASVPTVLTAGGRELSSSTNSSCGRPVGVCVSMVTAGAAGIGGAAAGAGAAAAAAAPPAASGAALLSSPSALCIAAASPPHSICRHSCASRLRAACCASPAPALASSASKCSFRNFRRSSAPHSPWIVASTPGRSSVGSERNCATAAFVRCLATCCAAAPPNLNSRGRERLREGALIVLRRGR